MRKGSEENISAQSHLYWQAMDNPKQFMALVNGVFLRTFQKDESITPELLKEEVFPGDDISIEGACRGRMRSKRNCREG